MLVHIANISPSLAVALALSTNWRKLVLASKKLACTRANDSSGPPGASKQWVATAQGRLRSHAPANFGETPIYSYGCAEE